VLGGKLSRILMKRARDRTSAEVDDRTRRRMGGNLLDSQLKCRPRLFILPTARRMMCKLDAAQFSSNTRGEGLGWTGGKIGARRPALRYLGRRT